MNISTKFKDSPSRSSITVALITDRQPQNYKKLWLWLSVKQKLEILDPGIKYKTLHHSCIYLLARQLFGLDIKSTSCTETAINKMLQ